MDDRYLEIFWPSYKKKGQSYLFSEITLVLFVKKIKLIGDWINLQTRTQWKCLTCDYTWTTTAAKIINSTGCAKCYGNLPLTNEIVDTRIKNLSLSLIRLSDWKGYRAKMIWKCTKCNNTWLSKPGNILQQHTSCPHCRPVSYSKKAINWLTQIEQLSNIKIQHAEQGGEYTIPGTTLKVDGFCKETNTVYEFYGDIFHGNPTRYKPEQQCNPYTTKTAKDLHMRTLEKEKQIIDREYTLITIWEYDYDKEIKSKRIF